MLGAVDDRARFALALASLVAFVVVPPGPALGQEGSTQTRLPNEAAGASKGRGSRTAGPGHLREAEQAYDGGRLEAALERYQQALSSGELSPSQVVHAQRGLGILLGAAGKTEEAREAFRVAVAIDPSLSPPPELGPPIEALFQEAKAAQGGAKAAVRAQWLDRTHLQMRVENLPPNGISGFRVVQGDSPIATVPSSGGEAATRILEAHSAVSVRVEAFDQYGNTLTAIEVHPYGAQEEGARPPQSTHQLLGSSTSGSADVFVDDQGSIWTNPWLWIGTAVLLIAGGAAIALAASAEEQVTVGAPEVL